MEQGNFWTEQENRQRQKGMMVCGVSASGRIALDGDIHPSDG
jgi:hypothetical protein